MTRIFISYSHDDKVIAERLAKLLRKSYNDVWLDDKLRGGDDWWEEIISHIADSTCFIVLLSPEAVSSKYCIQELDAAHKMNKFIVPVKIRRSTELPTTINYLNDLHIIEMLGDVTIEGLNKIYSSIINAKASSIEYFLVMNDDELKAERRKHDLELLDWCWYMVGNKYIRELSLQLEDGSPIEQDEFEDHIPLYRILRTVSHFAFIDNELEKTFAEFDLIADEFLKFFRQNYGETKDYENYVLKRQSKEQRRLEALHHAASLTEKSKEMTRVVMRWYPKFFVAE